MLASEAGFQSIILETDKSLHISGEVHKEDKVANLPWHGGHISSCPFVLMISY